MENIFDTLMEVTFYLIEAGYKVGLNTLLDIKNERADREILLVSNNNIKLYYNENKLHLETTYSNRKIDDDFINVITYLNTLKNDFNKEF